ncbi:hypothetical protein H0R92_08655 [Treponema sp. OMZ 840]
MVYKAQVPHTADTDYAAIREGYVSISRIFSQPCSAAGSFDIPADFFKMP